MRLANHLTKFPKSQICLKTFIDSQINNTRTQNRVESNSTQSESPCVFHYATAGVPSTCCTFCKVPVGTL